MYRCVTLHWVQNISSSRKAIYHINKSTKQIKSNIFSHIPQRVHLGEVEFNLIKLPVIIGSLSRLQKHCRLPCWKLNQGALRFYQIKNVIDLKADMMYCILQWERSGKPPSGAACGDLINSISELLNINELTMRDRGPTATTSEVFISTFESRLRSPAQACSVATRMRSH